MNPSSPSPIDPLIQDNWPKLKRFFRAKVPEPDCYELVQETLLTFVQKHREGGITSPRAFLWGIARMKALKYISGKRAAAVDFNSEIHSVMGPESTLSTRFDRRNKVMTALRSLPIENQMAFELHYGEGLTNEEVAASLGKSPATVKRYIKDAREAMQVKLAAMAPEEIGSTYRSG
ncbi:MAG TPA: sigma-70 family RNA polymerase sigma factor [Nannocystaceae bacterium]|nr:sigma-70 family RNA polymerase sigma factor [Nannocystaceae bacterium]